MKIDTPISLHRVVEARPGVDIETKRNGTIILKVPDSPTHLTDIGGSQSRSDVVANFLSEIDDDAWGVQLTEKDEDGGKVTYLSLTYLE